MAVQIQQQEKKCPAGLPAWLATFGDLMSLLLCFFVLLLSFATIDAKKMKKVISGLDKAFGVQNVVPASATPMGTSIISDKFSPNVTKKTTKESVKQETTDSKVRKYLDMKQGADGEETEDEKRERIKQEVEEDTAALSKELKLETFIRSAEVQGTDTIVMVRLKDRAAFKSGKANLNRRDRKSVV